MGDGIPAFHLSLPVRDLDETVAFYVDVLGCERRRAGSGWVDVDFFGHQLSLHLADGVAGSETTEVDGTAVPLRHHGVVLEPDDWEAMVASLRAAGVRFTVEPQSRFEGKLGEQHTCFVADPSGNAIELKAFPGGHWR